MARGHRDEGKEDGAVCKGGGAFKVGMEEENQLRAGAEQVWGGKGAGYLSEQGAQ